MILQSASHSALQRQRYFGVSRRTLTWPLQYLRKPCTPLQPPRLGCTRVSALHIDRRRHLETSWQHQQVCHTWNPGCYSTLERGLRLLFPKQAEDAQQETASQAGPSEVQEVRNLHHLDQICEAAGSSVVVVAFYSRSCGACKEMLKHYRSIYEEACRQKAGVRFLMHNVRDAFDDLTDIAALYRIKAVPAFVFFVGGAQMRRMSMADSRGDPSAIRRVMGRQRVLVADTLREMLFFNCPSARR